VSKVEHLLGLTPALKRVAWAYLRRGEGVYSTDLLGFDRVVVKELYPLQSPADAPPQGGMIVEFWRVGRRVRWLDFGCRVTGGGGDPIIREV
jgi:hypothetical protein